MAERGVTRELLKMEPTQWNGLDASLPLEFISSAGARKAVEGRATAFFLVLRKPDAGFGGSHPTENPQLNRT